MPTQTARASRDAPGFVEIREGSELILTFYSWDVTAVHQQQVRPDPLGDTIVSLRRNQGLGFWLACRVSVGEVQAAIATAVQEWKKTRSKVTVRKATAATG